MANALIRALWKQLRMCKVTLRCDCLCDRQGLIGSFADFIYKWLQKPLDFPVFWLGMYGSVWSKLFYAINCIMGWLGYTMLRMGCKDVLDTDQD